MVIEVSQPPVMYQDPTEINNTVIRKSFLFFDKRTLFLKLTLYTARLHPLPAPMRFNPLFVQSDHHRESVLQSLKSEIMIRSLSPQ